MKYEAIKIVSMFVPHPLFQWLSILVWWLKQLQMHMLFVGWYMKTNAKVIKLYKNKGNFDISPIFWNHWCIYLFIRPIILIFNLKTQN